MQKLTHADLWKLEDYARERTAFRAKVIAHKKTRTVHLGPHLTLIFEDRMTVQYQVQEMLRIERIFEPHAIDEELGAYNPLIPDGANWKATFLLEFPDADERRERLAQLKGVEDRCWVQVTGCERVYAIADEDLERENDDKTSSVHFLRFELSPQMCAQVKAGAAIGAGIDHDNYRHAVASLPQNVRESIAKDIV
jgi:uncharacterized protein DUF3501